MVGSTTVGSAAAEWLLLCLLLKAHNDAARGEVHASVCHAAVGMFMKLAGPLAGWSPQPLTVPLLLGRLMLRGRLSLPLGMLPLLPASTVACHALASARGSALDGCACDTQSSHACWHIS